MKTCLIPGCNHIVSARGWCRMHYKRWKRNGDPAALKIDTSPTGALGRFFTMVQKTSSCWIWIGQTVKGGYGRFRIKRKWILAHRFSYEKHIGTIASGMQIDHTCCVTGCVNPFHLEAVTPQENSRRAVLRGRSPSAAMTECRRGHPFNSENTRIDKNGRRRCKECARLSGRRCYWKLRWAERQDMDQNL